MHNLAVIAAHAHRNATKMMRGMGEDLIDEIIWLTGPVVCPLKCYIIG